MPVDREANWTEHGPNNVGGRSRAIMFDPNDATNKKFSGINRYSPNSFINKKSTMNLLDFEVFISNQNY